MGKFSDIADKVGAAETAEAADKEAVAEGTDKAATKAASQKDEGAELPGKSGESGEEADPQKDDIEKFLAAEPGPVPYARFRESRQELKRAKAELQGLKEEFELSQLQVRDAERRALTAAQANSKNASDDYLDLDEDPGKSSPKLTEALAQIKAMKDELGGLKAAHSQASLRNELSTLKSAYPELIEEHVLALKKYKPDLTLDEAAELSHTMVQSRVRNAVSKILEEKKKQQQQQPKLTGVESVLKFKGERPKTIGEATKVLRRMLGDS